MASYQGSREFYQIGFEGASGVDDLRKNLLELTSFVRHTLYYGTSDGTNT